MSGRIGTKNSNNNDNDNRNIMEGFSVRHFFEPESVAIIGASRKTGPGAYNGVEMMLRYGYQGRIYPINPKADEICGFKTYPSIMDVPEIVDLVMISLGREHVLPALNDCIKSGIRSFIIISQGFSDADQRGRELQTEISATARATGVRVLGPNTLGVLNNFRHFNTGFMDVPKPEKVPPVSLIAQTGLIQIASEHFSWHGWGKAVDIGNACDIDFVDALEYFGVDPDTQVIAMHMEGVLRGREFLMAASRITPSKPIIVLKTGRTNAGAKAALSHTASLVGEDDVNDAAFRRAGIIRVKTASGMKDAIRSFLKFDEMIGNRIGVLTPTGAGGIMATDACEDFDFKIGSLPDGLSDKLKQGIPDWVNIGNPIDIWPVGMLGKGYTQAYQTALTELLKSPDIDGVLGMTPYLTSPLHEDMDAIGAVGAARQETGSQKPVALWAYGGDTGRAADRFESINGVACFDTIEQAVQGLSFRYRYHQIRKRHIPSQQVFPYEYAVVERLLQKGREHRVLLGEDALALLSAFGIAVVQGRIAHNWREIEAAAAELTPPLVLKLSGDAFLHKSEWGGVITGLQTRKELHMAYQRIRDGVHRRSSKARIGFQIQEQATGKELLLGLKHDPQFGHVIACGFGGIYTEVFKDISRELVPVGRQEAEQMLSSLKIYPLLKGTRGEAGVDLESLLDALERLSFLATRIPDIMELDINPLMTDSSGCRAVDARILW